ncbi:rab-like protein 6 [Histomonas meleagridis]|uniref:rab-like protein 6 n=1 Tax=Histomonas meleagridis TaxID=135588 RepID=UPI00355A933C|nr:rab-like protein 6 [Histomonas meleagridis]KAH0797545.1 rab-like protein 6 [Histomonas meleagridis]
MGNEESTAAGIQQQKPSIPNQSQSNPSVQRPAPVRPKTDHELLIVVRGMRRTGKSTLITCMRGLDFNEEYTATPHLEATEFLWKTPQGENVNITSWDVVEKALLPVDAHEKFDCPDSTTIDTFKRADGLIIMIDHRFPDTVTLAVNILKEAPPSIPILIFSNFMDVDNSDPTIPIPLREYIGRYFYVPGSLKLSQGLSMIASWLNLPLISSKKRMYYNLFKSLESDLEVKIADYASSAQYFIDPETAASHMPKVPVQIHKQQNANPQQTAQQQQQQQTPNGSIETTQQPQKQKKVIRRKVVRRQAHHESQEEEEPKPKPITQQRRISAHLDDSDEEVLKPNPLVKPRRSSAHIEESEKKETPKQNPFVKPQKAEEKENKLPKQKVTSNNKSDDEEKDFWGSDDDDSEQPKPNPFVKANNETVKANNEQPKPNPFVKANNETAKANNEQPKPNPFVKTNNETVKKEEIADDDDDDFWGDDDDDDDDADANVVLPADDESDDDDAPRPNPFVTKTGAKSNLYNSIKESERELKEHKQIVQNEQQNVSYAPPAANVEMENEVVDDDDGYTTLD